MRPFPLTQFSSTVRSTRTRAPFGGITLFGAGAFLFATLATEARGQVTSRMSLHESGAELLDVVSGRAGVSADGRYVTFKSNAPIVGVDLGHVYVRDRQTGMCTRMSLNTSGTGVAAYGHTPSISADGRHVAFASGAANLVSGDTNARQDIFVRDRQTSTTVRINLGPGGVQADDTSQRPTISADGSCVVYESDATNLVPGDTNARADIFVSDRATGTTERVSVSSGGVQAGQECTWPTISADGRFVCFSSFDPNLVPGDTNGFRDVFVRDRLNGTTEIVSLNSAGQQSDNQNYLACISEDGRYVAFVSAAHNLVSPPLGQGTWVFVRDRQNGTTDQVLFTSQNPGTTDLYPPAISADGRYVLYQSDASDLVPGDTNNRTDMFVYDRLLAATERVSVSTSGAQSTYASSASGALPTISADGRYVLFTSAADNFMPGGTLAGVNNIYIRDRSYSAMTSLCDPGAGGVIQCPCANPPSGPGRGCDNAAGTGGAVLSATGVAYLSQDTLVFTASGEERNALNLLFQGNALAPGGAVFGRGVRCAGGALKHLFTKSASLGSASFPDFGAGDPTIHARSAAVGDPITAGESRWYVVQYRDSRAARPMPAPAEPFAPFNATQTGVVVWFY